MRPFRVVHMTSVHSPLDHRIFSKEGRALARAGFEVTVVGPHPEDTMREHIRIKSVPRLQSRSSRMTKTVWRVYREALKQHADVYHFHDPELIPVALLLRARGRKVVCDIHEDYSKDVLVKNYLPRWSRRLLAQIVERIEAVACRHFSALVTVTPSIADRFLPVNRRTIVLYNYPHADELVVRAEVPWEQRKPAVTYIGTITPQRGIAEMVEAVGRLPDSLAAALEIAGDTMPEEIRTLSGWSRVNFHGALDQPAAYQLLFSARAGLSCQHPIPSFLESVPVKVFEYMGAGLPVILSNFPFWRKMLDGIGCAIFVDPKNVCEIANAIEFVLTHPQEAEEMGRRGQAAVKNRFNWNTQAVKLVELYHSLVDQPCAA